MSFFLLLSLSVVRAQRVDYQLWTDASVSWDLNDNWGMKTELGQRFSEWGFRLSRSLLTVSASRDLGSYLSLAGGLRTVLVINVESRASMRYRAHFDIRPAFKWKGLKLDGRVRLQYGFEELFAVNTFQANALINRNRVQISNHIFGTRFHWDFYAESWHGMIGDSWKTYAMRYSAGLRYDLNFSSRLTLRYILEHELNLPDRMLINVANLSYGYRF